MTDAGPEEVVRAFCDAWKRRDVEAIVASFTDDAVYHNIPMDPLVGPEAIRTFLEGFLGGVDAVEFRIGHLAVQGDVVLTERVDAFRFGEREAALPVMGAFEVRGGKVAAWRDYFDMQQFMTQVQG